MFNLWHAFFYIADTFLNSPNIDKYADKKIFHSLIIYFIFSSCWTQIPSTFGFSPLALVVFVTMFISCKLHVSKSVLNKPTTVKSVLNKDTTVKSVLSKHTTVKSVLNNDTIWPVLSNLSPIDLFFFSLLSSIILHTTQVGLVHIS